MAGIHITDIESAINWWRERAPSSDGVAACHEVRALAEVYALMVYFHEAECDEDSMPKKAREAWLRWYDTTPDAPCIAICSTSQGDDTCKGCGRSFDEVQNWTVMTPSEKRQTWRRITIDGTAWRFNRYAERARTSGSGRVFAAPMHDEHAPRSEHPESRAAAASDELSIAVRQKINQEIRQEIRQETRTETIAGTRATTPAEAPVPASSQMASQMIPQAAPHASPPAIAPTLADTDPDIATEHVTDNANEALLDTAP